MIFRHVAEKVTPLRPLFNWITVCAVTRNAGGLPLTECKAASPIRVAGHIRKEAAALNAFQWKARLEKRSKRFQLDFAATFHARERAYERGVVSRCSVPAGNTLGRWNSQRNFDRDFAAASHCVSERKRGEVSHYAPASGKHVGLLELSKRFVQGLRLLSCAKRLRCRRAVCALSIENMP